MNALQEIILSVRSVIIRCLRFAFRIWPFLHGRGWILRAARLLLGTAPVRFDIGDGAVIEGPLSDFVVVWAFMREHERDAPFQHSLALLEPGSVAIDAGANLGIWSLLAARRGARVQAFEPVPALAERLRQHIRLSGAADSVAVKEVALGEERASLPFFAVPDGNTGNSSLARHCDDGIEIRVDVVPLDELTDHADLMKVDVEGAEILVFRGARNLLSSDDGPIIFFEINEVFCNRFGTSSVDVKRFLAGCGYAIYRWRRGRFVAVGLDEKHSHEDLFALKPRHMSKMPVQ